MRVWILEERTIVNTGGGSWEMLCDLIGVFSSKELAVSAIEPYQLVAPNSYVAVWETGVDDLLTKELADVNDLSFYDQLGRKLEDQPNVDVQPPSY